MEGIEPCKHFAVIPEYDSYLEAFLSNLNNILYIFDESSLRQKFLKAMTSSEKLDMESSIEFSLALALGASYIDTHEPTVDLAIYLRGRVLLSTLVQWSGDLWMMRVLVLITVYHINVFPSSAYCFLGSFTIFMFVK